MFEKILGLVFWLIGFVAVSVLVVLAAEVVTAAAVIAASLLVYAAIWSPTTTVAAVATLAVMLFWSSLRRVDRALHRAADDLAAWTAGRTGEGVAAVRDAADRLRGRYRKWREPEVTVTVSGVPISTLPV